MLGVNIMCNKNPVLTLFFVNQKLDCIHSLSITREVNLWVNWIVRVFYSKKVILDVSSKFCKLSKLVIFLDGS